MFKKEEEKNKVGRPKLADDAMKKDSLITIGICCAMAFVLCVGGIGDFTNRTPWEVLSFQGKKIAASVAGSKKQNKTSSKPVMIKRTLVLSEPVKIKRTIKVADPVKIKKTIIIPDEVTLKRTIKFGGK